MANSELGYTPGEVIQQEGPNKGAIKDTELAEIGAQTEDELRSGNRIIGDLNPDEAGMYKMQGALAGRVREEKFFSKEAVEGRETSKITGIDITGSNLTQDEVRKFRYFLGELEGARQHKNYQENIQAPMSSAADVFVKEHERLVEERKDEEAK